MQGSSIDQIRFVEDDVNISRDTHKRITFLGEFVHIYREGKGAFLR
jgi:hypothetical protein